MNIMFMGIKGKTSRNTIVANGAPGSLTVALKWTHILLAVFHVLFLSLLSRN